MSYDNIIYGGVLIGGAIVAWYLRKQDIEWKEVDRRRREEDEFYNIEPSTYEKRRRERDEKRRRERDLENFDRLLKDYEHA